MVPAGEGFFECRSRRLAGALYRFRLGGLDFPDPASRGQEKDVDWLEPRRRPRSALPGAAIRPWHEAVIAEVHVGTATEEGTFARCRKARPLRPLGFTAIEIMPVADFLGARNWGYDGVLPFAPDRSLWPPGGLRALVDAAHERGLVSPRRRLQPLRPDGNYLHRYTPALLPRAS